MQAVVQKLSDAPFNMYASQNLQYRANYVLVKVYRTYILTFFIAKLFEIHYI